MKNRCMSHFGFHFPNKKKMCKFEEGHFQQIIEETYLLNFVEQCGSAILKLFPPIFLILFFALNIKILSQLTRTIKNFDM